MANEIPFIKKIGEKLRPKLSAKEIKCILVGDNGIGKTKLILSYVHNSPRVTVESLNSKLHTPSIFTNRDIENSKTTLQCHQYENRDVKLHLWDTFGDHKQERGYSYNNADVICICFNIGDIKSLESIASHWLPETKRFCPDAPIVLVGLQADRRHNDPSKYVQSKRKIHSLGKYLKSQTPHRWQTSPLLKDNPMKLKSTIDPEICRKVASDIGALFYFETSVATKFGVYDLFAAAAQLGMMRRLKKFSYSSLSSLRRFENCHLKIHLMQAPYLHEKVQSPRIGSDKESPNPQYQDIFFASLYKEVLSDTPSLLTDVEFVFKDRTIFSHSLVLTLCVPALKDLFQYVIAAACSHGGNAAISHQGNAKISQKNCASHFPEELSAFQDFHVLDNYGACTSCDDGYQPRFRFKMAGQAVAFQRSLELYYTGCLSDTTTNIVDIAETAKSCCFHEVLLYLDLNFTQPVTRDILALRTRNATRELLERPDTMVTDLIFRIGEDLVEIPAHKLIVSQRCEVFSAMLTNGAFAERLNSKVNRNGSVFFWGGYGRGFNSSPI